MNQAADRAPIVLSDHDLLDRLDPHRSVEAVRQAMRDCARGAIASPARGVVPAGAGTFTFTCGVGPDWYGYRAYDSVSSAPDRDQIVVAADPGTGKVNRIAVGRVLGRARTGSIGAVAIDLLSRPESRTLGLIGTGSQAWWQLWALRAVRPGLRVRVYSRSATGRAEFAARAADLLDIDCEPVDSAMEAVADADIVVLATNSGEPVIETEWIAAGAHVTTLGPKQRGRCEYPESLLRRADLLFTDSVDQLLAYEPEAVAADADPAWLCPLADAPIVRDPSHVSVFLSVGLSATEVALLHAL
ncbi:ornithine cyclodeaminase family protein [Nocardia terpenica]|uniref:Ornithine cyclodeaminase n=1 Tax=Nocardia terpenica TaxID=455432 RepID=A0A291RRC0_9NOCA|nr:ornithine cyclodeaminase family protein [Nocardia terpenica]ATL70023.1 ornithine cyclodeaminase [Nocardia terpenica]